MRSLRLEQIVLLLVFVLVPLVNLLARWLKRRAHEQQRPAPAGPRAVEPVAPEERRPVPVPPRVRVIEPAFPRESAREAPPPRRALRRSGPLGGRAAVRRAVVAMTILGPCRGLEEPPAMTPAPRSAT